MGYATNLKILLFATLVMCMSSSKAQNLNGKRIYVSSSMMVMLKFHSDITDYDFAKESESLFERNIINSRNLKINSTVEDFKPTNLVITEGKNTHSFILEYKEELSKNEFVYDFSDPNKLEQEAKILNEGGSMAPASEAKPPKPVVSTNGGGGTNPGSGGGNFEPPTPTGNNVENKFLEIRTNANIAFLKNDFDEAEKLYRQALDLKAGDQLCLNKLEEIKSKKNNAAAKKMNDEKLKLQIVEYNKHKDLGDNALASKAYDIAETEYNEALKYKPNDPYIFSQLSKIDLLKKEEVLGRYKAYMDAGRLHLNNHLFDDAELAFRNALSEKADDPEAKRLLSTIPAEKRAYELKLKEDEKNKAFERKYRDTLQFADDAFNAELFSTAKSIYIWAAAANKNDPYPKNRIAEIDGINLKLKNESDQRRKDSLNKVKYDDVITKAEREVNSKNYKKAIETLKIAQELMPSSKYPAARISEIELIVKSEDDARKAATEKIRRQDSLNREYTTAMQKCNTAMKNKQYSDARVFALKALAAKGNDMEAGRMLVNIDGQLAEMEKDRMYNRYVEIGDSVAYTLNDLDGSLKWYDSASAIKPQEQRGKKQSEIVSAKIFTRDSLLFEQNEEEKRTAAYNESISLYKAADLARKEKRYGEAFTGYTTFLSKVDTQVIDKYSQKQQYYIKNAMDYRKSLNEYKPRTASASELKTKYPAIDLSKAPAEQSFGSPVLSGQKNSEQIKLLLSKDARNILMVTENRIKLLCQGIYFTDNNVYLKFAVRNSDTTEFLAGPMMLELSKSNGSADKLPPLFISEFPVVFPGEEKSFVYVIKNLIIGNNETLYLELTDRLNRTHLKLTIPAAVYHSQRIL